MSKPIFQITHDFTQIKLTILLELAEPLFLELNQLLNSAKDSNLEQASEKFKLELKKFEANALSKNLTAITVNQAHYILCSFIDEMILQAQLKQKFFWSQHSLLSCFHNDTHGGEKFFLILNEALRNTQTQRDLLELIYVCLAMGFQGKYRIIDEGPQQLEKVYQKIGYVLKTGAALKFNTPKNIRLRISWCYRLSHSWWSGCIIGFLAITVTYSMFNHNLQVHFETVKARLHAYKDIGG